MIVSAFVHLVSIYGSYLSLRKKFYLAVDMIVPDLDISLTLSPTEIHIATGDYVVGTFNVAVLLMTVMQ